MLGTTGNMLNLGTIESVGLNVEKNNTKNIKDKPQEGEANVNLNFMTFLQAFMLEVPEENIEHIAQCNNEDILHKLGKLDFVADISELITTSEDISKDVSGDISENIPENIYLEISDTDILCDFKSENFEISLNRNLALELEPQLKDSSLKLEVKEVKEEEKENSPQLNKENLIQPNIELPEKMFESESKLSPLDKKDKEKGFSEKKYKEQIPLESIDSDNLFIVEENTKSDFHSNLQLSQTGIKDASIELENTVLDDKSAAVNNNNFDSYKSEIVKQVVNKVDFLTENGKSEMTIELKPESLGKLSLKVSTEGGIVVAKFTAETDQVKQILETNMQILKDALEKQGISVQGFSVSVRDQSFKNSNKEGEMRRKKTRINGPSTYGSTEGIIDVSPQEINKNVDIYKINGKKIDLTA